MYGAFAYAKVIGACSDRRTCFYNVFSEHLATFFIIAEHFPSSINISADAALFKYMKGALK